MSRMGGWFQNEPASLMPCPWCPQGWHCQIFEMHHRCLPGPIPDDEGVFCFLFPPFKLLSASRKALTLQFLTALPPSMSQGFVDVMFWGFSTSLSSICQRLYPKKSLGDVYKSRTFAKPWYQFQSILCHIAPCPSHNPLQGREELEAAYLRASEALVRAKPGMFSWVSWW